MQWRSALVTRTLAPLLIALVAAGCAEDVSTGPRIATVSVISGNNQTGPIGGLLAQPLVIRVEDQRGDPVPDAVVNWQVTSGNGIVSPRSDTTDADGFAETTFRLGSAIGVQTVSATLPGLSPISFTATGVSAPASKLFLVAGSGQTAEVGRPLPLPLQVRATDAFDNPKSGVAVTFTVLTGGGAVSSNTVSTDASGIATVNWTLGPLAGTQTLIAGSGQITPVSFTASGTPAGAANIQIVSGGDQVGMSNAALPDSIVLRVVDQYGNGVPGVQVNFVLGSGSGSASPSSATSNATGRVATRWTLGPIGGPNSFKAEAGTFSLSVPGAGYISFETVNAGGITACGIDQGGVLFCWGSNNDGALGIGVGPTGSGPVFAFPQSVVLNTTQTFGQVNGGQYHNCAVTHSHVGYCWGDNNNGQLGTGTNTRMEVQPTLIDLGIAFSQVSSGRSHSCGVTIGGRVHCWGNNERGQLGGNVEVDTTINTTTLLASNVPVEVGSMTDGSFFGVYDFMAVSAGGVHTCALTHTGAARCWGLGREGQRGDGSTSVDEYVPQTVVGGHAFMAISAGFNHTCALNNGGTAYCWGNNANGQLGDGTTGNSSAPVAVSTSQTFVSISAGYAHTCAVTNTGSAFCWGANAKGQLGSGTLTQTSIPVAVVDGFTYKTISAGDWTTCGITTGGVAMCWGDNEYGSIGDGSQLNRPRPTRVRFQQ